MYYFCEVLSYKKKDFKTLKFGFRTLDFGLWASDYELELRISTTFWANSPIFNRYSSSPLTSVCADFGLHVPFSYTGFF